MEKKPWEKPGSVGGPVPLRPDEPVVCSNCSKVFSNWIQFKMLAIFSYDFHICILTKTHKESLEQVFDSQAIMSVDYDLESK